MKHIEENRNSHEMESEQIPKKDEKDLKQPTIRRLMHADVIAELNKDLGIINASTDLEKRLEVEDRHGNAISITFFKREK